MSRQTETTDEDFVEGEATSLTCPKCGSDDITYTAPADVKSGGYGGMVYDFNCEGCGAEWQRAQPVNAPEP